MADDRGVIVVGVDGSGHSERAVTWAVNEARVHGDRVVLLHAWQYPNVAMTSYAGEPLPVFGHGDLEKLAARVLAHAAAAATRLAPDVDVETRLIEDHPGRALVDASADARMLVVGSRGLGGFSGVLMGSVSSSCAHHAVCPVVIVPGVTAGEQAAG